jgi:hypothetical protein
VICSGPYLSSQDIFQERWLLLCSRSFFIRTLLRWFIWKQPCLAVVYGLIAVPDLGERAEKCLVVQQGFTIVLVAAALTISDPQLFSQIPLKTPF